MLITTILHIIPILLIISLIVYVVYSIKSNLPLQKSAVLVVVGVIIVCAIIVPMTENEENEPISVPDSIGYDDYIEVEPNAKVTGALNLVGYGGKLYAHGNSLGTGTITQNGQTTTITVEKSVLDVFLLIGQSNAAYGYYDQFTGTNPSIGNGYYYGTYNKAMYYGASNNPTYDTTFESYALYDMSYSNVKSLAHLEGPFANEYKIQTGHKVLVVNGAISGTGIQDWIPGGYCYEYAKEVWAHAIAEIDQTNFDINICGYIWIQGENNAKMEVDTYKEYFLQMHNALLGISETDVFNEDYSLPLALISKVRVYDYNHPWGSWGGNAINPAEAQIELAEEYPTIYLASTIADTFTIENGLVRDDNVHYSQKGFNILGKTIAEFYGENIYE